jgi:hypothetical protein
MSDSSLTKKNRVIECIKPTMLQISDTLGSHLRFSDSTWSVGTMQELLIDELKDLYSAEKQIIRALPKLAKAATSPDLMPSVDQSPWKRPRVS